MNEIKKDLNIMELDRTEFLSYSFEIIKRNFLNFLPLITVMILLKICIMYMYKIDVSYKISKSRYGMKIYEFFTDMKIEWFLDRGRGKEWFVLGLDHRLQDLADLIYLLFNSILFLGVVISVCKYIDKGIKTNPLREIKGVILRFLKVITAGFLAGLVIGRMFGENEIINISIYIFLVFLAVKCLFFYQEYFYQRNSMIKSIKNSFNYVTIKLRYFGLFLILYLFLWIAGILGLHIYLPEMITVFLTIFFQLFIVVLITLNYFKAKYLDDSKIAELAS